VSSGGHDTAGAGRVNRVSFTLPSLPGSVNLIYGLRRTLYSSQPQWGLKDEWAIWVTKMMPHVQPLPHALERDSVIRVDRTYYYSWFCKNGSWRVADTSNMDKLTFDLIARKLGVNDLMFKLGMMDSVDSGNPRVEVTLTEVMRTDWEKRRERLI